MRREDLQEADGPTWDANNATSVDEELQARINAQIAVALGLNDEDEDEVEEQPLVVLETSDKRNCQRSYAQQLNGACEDLDSGKGNGNENDEDHDEPSYEFNLFSTGAATGPSRVILEDATKLGHGAFARQRPLSCYTTKNLSAKQKGQYSYAAVTAEDVMLWSTRPSWGMAMPWRVVTISSNTPQKARLGGYKSMDNPLGDVKGGGDASNKKKRPGKKQRIATRKQRAIREHVMEVAATKQAEKEEQIKDKKKRLNRIKKLRKRAKEKERKLEGVVEGAAGDDSGSGGDE